MENIELDGLADRMTTPLRGRTLTNNEAIYLCRKIIQEIGLAIPPSDLKLTVISSNLTSQEIQKKLLS